MKAKKLLLLLLLPFLSMSLIGMADTMRAPRVVPGPKFQPDRHSQLSQRGAGLFAEKQCANCHSIQGKGGCLGPPLDGEGGVRSKEFLLSRLTNSESAIERFAELYGEPEIMQHPRFAPEKAQALVAYIRTLPSPQHGFLIYDHPDAKLSAADSLPDSNFKPLPVSQSSVEGRHLYADQGCATCHAIGKVGGWFGPRLDGIGGRRSRSHIIAHISDAQLHVKLTTEDPQETPSRMPRFDLSQEDINKIADFLLTLPQK